MSDFERHLADQVNATTPDNPPPYAGVLARRDRRRTRRRVVWGSVGAGVLVAAVIGGAAALQPDPRHSETRVADPSTSEAVEPTSATSSTQIPDVAPDWDEKGAPPVVLQLAGGQAVVEPWGYCYGNSCIHGMPQPPFEDVGDRAEVPFSFPLKRWTFEASFSPSSDSRCERTINVPVEKTGDYTFAVPPAGPPGAYDVNVFGRGPEGDVITTFAWTTTETGFLPEPSGYAGIVADNDGEFDSYGVEIGIEALADTPREASVKVTVTAANGRSTTIGPLPADELCAGDGLVSFVGGQADGKRAAALGPAPFDYLVEVTMDGQAYLGTAVWPRDEKPDLAPYTTLTFDPPLPAYTG